MVSIVGCDFKLLSSIQQWIIFIGADILSCYCMPAILTFSTVTHCYINPFAFISTISLIVDKCLWKMSSTKAAKLFDKGSSMDGFLSGDYHCSNGICIINSNIIDIIMIIYQITTPRIVFDLERCCNFYRDSSRNHFLRSPINRNQLIHLQIQWLRWLPKRWELQCSLQLITTWTELACEPTIMETWYGLIFISLDHFFLCFGV